MSTRPDPFVRVLDANGDPVSGGKLYTYKTDTTTPQAAYSDEGLTTALPNPIVANAAGYLADGSGDAVPIYLLEDTAYYFKFTDADDNELRTVNNLYGLESQNSGVLTRIKQLCSCPLDYGAEGDGSTNDAVALQAALDAAESNGAGWVDLAGKTYACNSMLTVATGVKVRNGTLDFSSCTDTTFVRLRGTLTAIEDLSSDAAYGDVQITLNSISGLFVGDLIGIYCAGAYIGDLTRGELAVVEYLTGSNVDVSAPICDAYTTAKTATVKKVNSLNDNAFEDVTFIGAEAAAGNRVMLELVGVRRCRLRRCRFNAIDYRAVVISSSYDVKLEDCTFQHGALGVFVVDSSQYIEIVRPRYEAVTAPITIGNDSIVSSYGIEGPARFVTVRDGDFHGEEGSGAPITIDDSAEYIRIENNKFRADRQTTAAIICEAVNVRIVGNDCQIISASVGGETDAFLQLATKVPVRSDRDYFIEVARNRFEGENTSYFIYGSVGASAANCALADVAICDNQANQGINLTLGSGASNPDFGDIRFERNWLAGTIALTTDNLAPISSLKLRKNDCAGITVNGDATGAITELHLEKNDVAGNVSIAGLVSGAIVRIRGGHTTGTTLIDEGSQVYIEGHDSDGVFEVDNASRACQLHVADSSFRVASGLAFEFDASESVTKSSMTIVDSDFYSGDDDALEISGYITRGLIANCRCHAAVNGIELAGDAAGAIDSVHIDGCVLYSCGTGIKVATAANVTNLTFGDNTFPSCTTEVSGDFTAPRKLENACEIKAAHVQVSSAQLLQAKAGVDLIAAVADKILVPIAGVIQYNYGTVAYTITAAGDDLALYWDDGAGPPPTQRWSAKIETTGLIDQAADRFTVFGGVYESAGYGDLMQNAECINKPLALFNIGANNFTNGDGTLEVTLFYMEITVK